MCNLNLYRQSSIRNESEPKKKMNMARGSRGNRGAEKQYEKKTNGKQLTWRNIIPSKQAYNTDTNTILHNDMVSMT